MAQHALYFAVASGGNIEDLQLSPAELHSTQVPTPNWAADPVTTRAAITSIAVSEYSGFDSDVFDAFKEAFEITGPGVVGSLELNLATLNDPAFDATARSAIISTFEVGGTLTFTINDAAPPPGTGSETFTVQLRAIKTTKFLMNGPSLQPLPSTVTNNLVLPDTVGNYTVAFDRPATPDKPVPGNLVVDAPATATNTTWQNLALNAAGSSAGDLVGHGTELSISRTDPANPGDPARTSTLFCDIHVPTDLVLSFDRSGSMNASTAGTDTKWQAAVKVGNMLSTLYAELLPQFSLPNGSVAALNTILLTKWYYNGATQFEHEPNDGTVTNPVPAAGSAMPQFAAASPGDAGGGTPIGDALLNADSQFTPSQWRRRTVVLLTDGKHNSGTADLNASDLSNTTFPHDPATAAKDARITLHNIQYLQSGGGPSFNAFLNQVQQDSLGTFHDTSPDTDPLASDLLFEKYLDVLSDMMPVDKMDVVGTTNIPAEPGLDRAVFIATNEDATAGALTVQRSGTNFPSANSGNGFTWVIVDEPSGDWTVTATPGGADVFVLYDLSLRFECGAEPAMVGEPIKLWATLMNRGRPVSGADVRLGARIPDESRGDVITRFIRDGGLKKALARGQISPLLMQQMRAAAFGTPLDISAKVDVPDLQGELLKLAEAQRNLELQYKGSTGVFQEVSPGRYEYTVAAQESENEYSRNFYIRADGTLPSGDRFARDRQFSVSLLPEPSPENTQVAVSAGPSIQGQVTWTINVVPQTAAKKPLGPGLLPYLFFQYIDPDLRKKLAPLPVFDNLDGSYRTTIVTKEGDKPPALELRTTTHKPGQKTGSVPIDPDRLTPEFKKVRVILEKVQVLDDKDPLWGAGELVFHTNVAPNGSPARAVQMRLPPKDYYSVSSGRTVETAQPIFEGVLEKDASLVISITGEELDWPQCLNHNDKLARYVRSIPIPKNTTKYTPDDEKNDPESLADWKVWYTVEVS